VIWPTGSINRIQLTENVMTAIPKVRNVGIAVLLLVTTTLLLRPNRIRRRWLKETLLALGICLALPTAVSILIAGCSLSDSNKPRVHISPDGSHVADHTYNAGFLGRDFSGVTVRPSSSMHPEEAYFYFGPSDWASTTVKWLDDSNLEIGYYPDPHGRTQQCNAHAAGIAIHCKIRTSP
jgi:hypothetical protein